MNRQRTKKNRRGFAQLFGSLCHLCWYRTGRRSNRDDLRLNRGREWREWKSNLRIGCSQCWLDRCFGKRITSNESILTRNKNKTSFHVDDDRGHLTTSRKQGAEDRGKSSFGHFTRWAILVRGWTWSTDGEPRILLVWKCDRDVEFRLWRNVFYALIRLWRASAGWLDVGHWDFLTITEEINHTSVKSCSLAIEQSTRNVRSVFLLFTSVLLETCTGLARSIDRLKRRLDGLPHCTVSFFVFSVFDWTARPCSVIRRRLIYVSWMRVYGCDQWEREKEKRDTEGGSLMRNRTSDDNDGDKNNNNNNGLTNEKHSPDTCSYHFRACNSLYCHYHLQIAPHSWIPFAFN